MTTTLEVPAEVQESDPPSRLSRLRVPKLPSLGRDGGSRAVRTRQPVTPQVWILWTIGGLAVWLLAYAFLFSGLQEHRAQAVLYTHFREALAAETAPIGNAAIPRGTPVAMMSAPQIGMKDLVAVEGTNSAALLDGPGHLSASVLPGQVGTSVLYGRSATFGAPFGQIDQLAAGDLIAVTTGEGEFNYKVDDVRRAGDPTPPALAAGGSRLVLVTSTGSSWRSGFAPGHALFVDATLHTDPQPAGITSALGPHDAAMAIDTGGLFVLVLWMEALLIVAVGIVWTSGRWMPWSTWLVGAPTLLFVLWGATSSAARLLPNLL